jgi:short/branched chain acyl-CoA dehydrogenase
MVDFRLTEEQEALRESVREFAREQVAPVIADFYEKKAFPYDLVRQMG